MNSPSIQPMKIHLISNLFHPDELAGAALYTDLALFFKSRGHDIRVTGTFSYYPAWKLRAEDEGVRMREENHLGIPLRRLKMYVPSKASGLKRLLSDASFLSALVRKARFPGWTPDVVISACPMLSQCVAQRFLYRGQNVPRLLIAQDFVVDAALELGMLRLPLLGGLLRKMERWALRSAETLSTISPEMLTKLKTKIGDDRRLIFTPNWIHGSLAKEIDSQRAQGIPRQSNRLMYSGNVGVKQGLPDFVEIFREMDTPWKLRIQGGGAEIKRLAEAVAACPFIEIGGVSDEAAYVRSLLEAGACLITQKAGVSANFLPSKLLPALATGTPVFAVCESDTPLAREILEGGYGAVVHPHDGKEIARTLSEWAANPELLVHLGKKARARAEIFGRAHVLGQYENELARLCLANGESSARDSLPTAAEPA